jgi:ATP-dependent DNA helicase RecQ
LKVAGVRRGYRFVGRPDSPKALIHELRERFRLSEERDIARITQVMGLGGERTCLVRSVLRYFGEELGRDCGHCDRCLGEPIVPPVGAVHPMPGDRELDLCRSVTGEPHDALGSSRQQARFLCGLASPATIRAKLTRDPRFGALGSFPFRVVLETLESLGAIESG